MMQHATTSQPLQHATTSQQASNALRPTPKQQSTSFRPRAEAPKQQGFVGSRAWLERATKPVEAPLAKHTPSIPYRWGVRRTGASSMEAWRRGTFDRTLYAKCGPDEVPLLTRRAHSADACEQMCRRHEDCHAVEFLGGSTMCKLFQQCLDRRAVAPPPHNHVPSHNLSMVMHRWGPSLPRSPSLVRWESNVSLVIASYDASLAWLASLRPGYFDVVVYQKRNFGMPLNKTFGGYDNQHAASNPAVRGTRQYVLKQLCQHGVEHRTPSLLDEPAAAGSAATVAAASADGERPHHAPLPQGLRFAQGTENCAPVRRLPTDTKAQPYVGRRQNLAYWTTLPNYGRTSGDPKRFPRGGSRESFVMFQFILDFWDNLPPVILFSQVGRNQMDPESHSTNSTKGGVHLGDVIRRGYHRRPSSLPSP